MKTGKEISRDLEVADAQFISTLGDVLNVHEFIKVAITSHSTRIEGSTLTLSEVINLIDKGTPATGKPINHQNMVLDHYEALEFVIDQASKKAAIDVSLIRTIASMVMRRTGKVVNSVLGNTDETQGDLRKVNVSAGGKYFVDQDKVPEMLGRLVANVSKSIQERNAIEDIYAFAFETHFALVSIHPFTDGNGRVSRLLMNFIEAYHNKPLTLVHEENKEAYFKSLKESDKLQSTRPIVEFLARQHIKFLNSQVAAHNEGTDMEMKPASKISILNENNPGYSIFF